jgi:hypothetical protein
MARALIRDLRSDLIKDAGAVLWSIVMGEQLEFPVTLEFLDDASLGYEYEAVVLEAENVPGQEEPPSSVRSVSPSKVALGVRVPTPRGAWDAAQAYNREETVTHGGVTYKLSSGVARVSATPPPDDPLWEEHDPRTVYVQFPGTLGSGYDQQPTVDVNVYGFFELRVTEPEDAVYRRTWKPVRGVVELLFSPADQVP